RVEPAEPPAPRNLVAEDLGSNQSRFERRRSALVNKLGHEEPFAHVHVLMVPMHARRRALREQLAPKDDAGGSSPRGGEPPSPSVATPLSRADAAGSACSRVIPGARGASSPARPRRDQRSGLC